MDKELNNLKEIFEIIRKLVNNIKYGSVTLVIQDGKIIQVDTQEKIRLK